jgi:hypothetical protein
MKRLLIALAVLLGALDSAPGLAQQRVQMGVSVLPDTVRVGDPFRVLVRVRAPAGAVVEFPPVPDSAGAVQALDPMTVRTTEGDFVDVTATYRLAAWQLEQQPIELGDVIVRANGERTVAPITNAGVYVQSVLPPDSTLHVPKPAKPIIALPVSPWLRWLLIALGVLLVALLAWWLWRRWKARRGAATGDVDAYQYAQREFERIEALGLIEAGERGRFVALMSDVMRDYLARRIPGAHPSLTSTELLRSMRATPVMPTERLETVLSEVDLVKFARRPVDADRARALAREARTVVSDVEQAEAAKASAAAQQAAA